MIFIFEGGCCKRFLFFHLWVDRTSCWQNLYQADSWFGGWFFHRYPVIRNSVLACHMLNSNGCMLRTEQSFCHQVHTSFFLFFYSFLFSFSFSGSILPRSSSYGRSFCHNQRFKLALPKLQCRRMSTTMHVRHLPYGHERLQQPVDTYFCKTAGLPRCLWSHIQRGLTTWQHGYVFGCRCCRCLRLKEVFDWTLHAKKKFELFLSFYSFTSSFFKGSVFEPSKSGKLAPQLQVPKTRDH